MNREDRVSEGEIDLLLERGRVIRPLPAAVRARALARAREAVATGGRATFEPAVSRRGGGFWIAMAASLALVAFGAGAFAAFRSRAIEPREPAPPTAPSPVLKSHGMVPPSASLRLPTAPEPGPALPLQGKPRHLVRPAVSQEAYRAELELVRRAQVAYAGRNYSDTLIIVSEHARRFPNGRLTEEREALRVRSLDGVGRVDEAHRAAGLFARRFPRSVLLPLLLE